MDRPYARRAFTRGQIYGSNIDELIVAMSRWAATAKTEEDREDLWDELRYAASIYPKHAKPILALFK
jgi:hypothetical protein